MNPTLLVDGDILCYSASSVTDGKRYRIHYTLKGSTSSIEERYAKDADRVIKELSDRGCTDILRETVYDPEQLENALHILKESIKSLKDSISIPIGTIRYFLSMHGSFREQESSSYKTNRTDMRRPEHLEECKQYLLKHYDAECRPGEYEADDLMAINQDSSTIICSIDKDLLQVPGRHFNFLKGEHKEITEEEGLRNLYSQILTGDSTDGIKGIHGVGPVTAKKILSKARTEQEMYEAVLKKYEESLETKETLRSTARLLYLMRSFDDKGWEAPLDRPRA